jgi:hypothetical protein
MAVLAAPMTLADFGSIFLSLFTKYQALPLDWRFRGCFASAGGALPSQRGLRHTSPAVGLPALRAQFQLPNFNFGGGSEGEASKAGGGGNVALKQKLLEICGDSRQGIEGTGSVSQEEFDGLVEQLIANNPTQNPAESSLMTGRWKMAWTTEKEILFCVEKGLFGLPCTDVYQTIDSSAGTLKNVIEFTDQGFLKVNVPFCHRDCPSIYRMHARFFTFRPL